jgi:2-oxoglutarate dehydrogenase E2 component (dihydrolipoamide succinyltransferase)
MATKVVVPELGESVVEATVGRWLKKQGETVHAGDVLVSLETEKIDLEVGAAQDGVLARIERQEGANVKIGDVLAVIEKVAGDGDRDIAAPKEAAAPTPSPAPRDAAKAGASAKPSAPRKATPLARKIAQEHGVSLELVPTSDADGRVRQHDVEMYIQDEPPSNAAAARSMAKTPDGAGTNAAAALPVSRTASAGGERREERVRMSRRRQTIARRLVEAQRSAAMLTTFNEIDMGAVMELRARWKERFKQQYGVGLGISSFFVKASIAALRDFPRLNAEIQGDEIVLKHYYDIGVAIGAEEGLVVPVLRDADRMTFAQIESGIKDFASKARERKLTLEELRGGTFTVTNGGIFGSLLSTPIVNPPQVGILGLHKIEERARPVEGKVGIRPMMYVALSYDHRIVDGREAVQFLVRLKQLLEDPASLLFET